VNMPAMAREDEHELLHESGTDLDDKPDVETSESGDTQPCRLPRAGRVLMKFACGVLLVFVPGCWVHPSAVFSSNGRSSFGSLESLYYYTQTCPAVNHLVQELRKVRWPRKVGPAPKITKFIYINLDRSKARRRYMENQFTKLRQQLLENDHVEITWQRLPAADAHIMETCDKYAEWRSKGFAQTAHPLVDGDWAIAACAHSHYEAIRLLQQHQRNAQSTNELVMIVEDDVEIDKDVVSTWETLWPYVPEEWDILRVGWFGDMQNCSSVINSHWDYADWQDLMPDETCQYCGAQGYLVRPGSEHRVLKRYETCKMTHSDTIMGAPTPPLEDPKKAPPLKVFVSWPRLAWTHMEAGYPAFTSDRRKVDITRPDMLSK